MNILNNKLSKGKEGLKKFGRRAQEKVLQKLGTHTSTSDPAFNSAIERVEKLDKNLKEINDAMEEYMRAVEHVSHASRVLAERFGGMLAEENDDFIRRRMAESYDDDDIQVMQSRDTNTTAMSASQRSELPVEPDMLKVVESFVNETKIIEAWSHEVISSACKECIVRPAGEKLKEIPNLKHKISTRQQKLLDYDSYRAKLNAEQSRNPDSEHSAKLAEKLDAARGKVDAVTNEVIQSCANIERDKTSLMVEGFASLVAIQTMMNTRSAQRLEPFLPKFPQAAPALCMICSKTHEQTVNKK